MTDPIVAKIEANPKYHELRRKRSSFGWSLTALMMSIGCAVDVGRDPGSGRRRPTRLSDRPTPRRQRRPGR